MDALRELEQEHARFGADAAERKLRALRALARTRVGSVAKLERIHELALFLRAVPDDARVLAAARALLAGFARRPDLRRWRERLADSGIAGTDLYYRFFLPTAVRLARAYPACLQIDWPSWDADQHRRLTELLPLLAGSAEGLAISEERLDARAWLRRACPAGLSDGSFLARRFGELEASDELRSQLWDELDPALVLRASAAGPARTRAEVRWLPVCFQEEPLRRERPRLEEIVQHAPFSVTRVRGARAKELVRLAQDAMAARARDLDAFMYADEQDVRLLDCGQGLVFAMFGVEPRQRLPLEAVHAFLTLRNGVPIGYVLSSALFGSCEVAYNVFETWRGAEAGQVYGRVLGMLRALFLADTFTIYPYQLGHENDEGLSSGAWWFYQKLGFRADDRSVLKLMRAELARLRRDPAQRSSRSTLRRLAPANVYWTSGSRRADVIGRLPLGRIGEAALEPLARHGSESACAAVASERLGLRSRQNWSAEERRAFARWSPIVLALGGLEHWNARERRSLVELIRLKGARDEVRFVRAFDRHHKLRRALCALARVDSSV